MVGSVSRYHRGMNTLPLTGLKARPRESRRTVLGGGHGPASRGRIRAPQRVLHPPLDTKKPSPGQNIREGLHGTMSVSLPIYLSYRAGISTFGPYRAPGCYDVFGPVPRSFSMEVLRRYNDSTPERNTSFLMRGPFRPDPWTRPRRHAADPGT